jgi:hypothetical protein
MKKVLFTMIFVVACFIMQAQISDPFFKHVTYSGAFGYEDWTRPWANYDPQNTVYPATTTTKSGHITSNETWNSSNSPVNGTALFTDNYLNDPFFEPVTFVGAFGPVDWTKPWANFDPQNTNYLTTTVNVGPGDLTTQTWTSNQRYKLIGKVYIPDGVTLTIQPGTIIRGDLNTEGTLIVERGGMLIAEGTPTQPIVFTSNQGIGNRDYGDWGGVIICGRANNNQGEDVLIEGLEEPVYYGGSDDNDNSGILKYVRIEFCGIALTPNNEINGLTMGSVGRGTTLDYVQVSYSGDDAFEWFGGTVNAKHLIAHRSWDDDFDTDFGYTGKVQFGVILRDPAIADVSGSNGFESSNDGTGSSLPPLTKPVFCNISMFGPKVTPSTTINSNHKRALHINKNSRCSVFNSLFSGCQTGLYIDGPGSQGATGTPGTPNDILRIEKTFFAGMVNLQESEAFDEMAYFNHSDRANAIYTNNTDLQIGNPFNLTNPDFLPTKLVYFLDGFVYVDTLVTLTIQPGSIIRGDKATKGTLIIKRGAKIIANGNKNEPIVFTSNITAGSRASGDWGGVIICGKANTNVPGDNVLIEGGPAAYYGGSDDNDDSGEFRYVRIEFPGVPLEPNKEINGLTMGAVGRATDIDHIQVSHSGDDAFEWFAGTVNCKYLISFKTQDDDFDTDQGFTGKVQFGVSLRDPAVADVSGSNGFESSNDGSGSTNTPFTQPTFSNMSIFGPIPFPGQPFNADHKRALRLDKSTRFSIHNSLFMGYPIGLDVDGGAEAQMTYDTLEYCFMSGMTKAYQDINDSSFYENPTRYNTRYTSNSTMLITDPFNLANPNFLPVAGSPVYLAPPLTESPVLFGSRWVKTVQGKVEYDNSVFTDLDSVLVTCRDNSGNLISSDLTNATGDYSLKTVDGVSNLVLSCDKTWANPTGSDVLRLRQHLVSVVTMTPLQVIACDVNLSGGAIPCSGADVLALRQKIVFLNPAAWVIPDWVFEPASVNILPGQSGTTTKNIKGLCSGDANGSHVPPTK